MHTSAVSSECGMRAPQPYTRRWGWWWWSTLAGPFHSSSAHAWLYAGTAYVWLPQGAGTYQEGYQKVSTRNGPGGLRLPPPKLSELYRCLGSDPTIVRSLLSLENGTTGPMHPYTGTSLAHLISS